MKKNIAKDVDIIYKNGVKQIMENKDIFVKIVKNLSYEKEKI